MTPEEADKALHELEVEFLSRYALADACVKLPSDVQLRDARIAELEDLVQHLQAVSAESALNLGLEIAKRDKRIAELEAQAADMTLKMDGLYDTCVRLQERIRELTEWRPMDTAPADDWILVRSWGSVFVACWSTESQQWRHYCSGDLAPLPDGWLPLPEVEL